MTQGRRPLPVAAMLVALALLPHGPSQAQEAPWPTKRWATALPEEQGLDPVPFASLDSTIRTGAFGNIDRLVVVRNGYLVVNARYDLDYRAISRGQSGDIGCGFEACPDEARVHQYNYLHPDFHPYHQGRDVHTLQSVTKSIARNRAHRRRARARRASTRIDRHRSSTFFDDRDLSEHRRPRLSPRDADTTC